MSRTTTELMELKRKAGALRDKSIQAKATMEEINKNIDQLKADLKELGIKNVENAQEEINQLEEKADKLYEQAEKKLEKWL